MTTSNAEIGTSDKSDTIQLETIEHVQPKHDDPEFTPPSAHIAEYQEAQHINLSWRSWMVVFVTCFAIMSQVFVVVAAGSVIAFIIRDLGDASIAGWIIQGPLLMQSVLSPIVGRLSDVLDRKYLAAIPPLIAFIGAVVSAKATSMAMLIGGGILIGTTLSTISITQAIPSEVLPMKYRPLANGFAFLGGAIGGLVGGIGAGAVTNSDASGWRDIFWMQAAFHLATSVGLLVFYNPPRRSDYGRMSLKETLWAIDPIGSLLFVTSATVLLLAMDWGGGAYAWSDAHVATPLAVGLVLMLLFAAYEWKGRSDGIVAHVFFEGSPNFALSVFAFAVEGWLFYSAVNSVTPQIVLNLGFENNSWSISVRQLAYSITTLVVSIPITLYATKYKDLKSPLLVTFVIFLVVTICYCVITPNMSKAQIGFNFLSGVGQSGPLTLLVAAVQFSAPHAFLSTATGLAFSARAIGGAFGSAVLDAIINSYLASHYASSLSTTAAKLGVPAGNIPAVVLGMTAGNVTGLGLDATQISGLTDAGRWVYAKAYRRAWASIVPFIVLAIVAVFFLKGVKELMTEKVEASVERREVIEAKELEVVEA